MRTIIFAVVFWPAVVLAGEQSKNLAANGDFTLVAGGKPVKWEAAGDSRSVTQELRVARESDGGSYAQLACTRCEPVGPASHAMLAQVGQVNLQRGRRYEFSCRVRADGLIGGVVSVSITDMKVWSNCGLEAQIPVTAQWKTFRRVFRATRDVSISSRLQIWFNEPGTLCVADVRIVECRDEDVELTDVVPPASGRNLLPNGSFELGAAGWSSIGRGAGWGNLDHLHGVIEDTGGFHGRSFLRIPMGPGRTPVIYFDYYEPVARRELAPLAASIGWIALQKDKPYTLSCYMRANIESTPAIIGVTQKDPAGGERQQRQSIKLAKQWARHSLTFRPQARYAYVTIGPDLRDDRTAVDVDVDAVQLEQGDAAGDFAPRHQLELSLEPLQRAGMFFDDEELSLILRVGNFAGVPGHVTVTFAVTDFEDKPLSLPQQTLEVPARSTVERKLKLPAD